MSIEPRKIAILVRPRTYRDKTSSAVTISQSRSLALITLYLGTPDKFTRSAGAVMALGKDNKWHIEHTSLKTTAKKLSGSSKLAGGRLTLSKTGRK